VTLETIMIGAKGFRAREATAHYKRRVRRLVSEEVRAARFANLHGIVETKAVGSAAPAKPEVTEETKVEQVAEQTEAGADADAGETEGDAEGSADEASKTASKKKAGKAKK
jgi:hypothetical protein